MPQRHYNNWLKEWCGLFQDTEVSEIYAMWSGIWTISAALQDNVAKQWGGSFLYPHMYIWLIGPPASGKSTAAEIGYDMLKTLPMNDSFSGEITRSRLISRLLGIAQKRALRSKEHQDHVWLYSVMNSALP